jgi:hypothetical protein
VHTPRRAVVRLGDEPGARDEEGLERVKGLEPSIFSLGS